MRNKLPILLWLIPTSLAAAYVVIFLAHLPRNLTQLAWDPDYSSAFTLPEAIVSAGVGGHTVISSSGQWVSLWFGLLTARLPLHRELWEIAPTLLFVTAALAVGWSVSRIAGRRAGVLAVALGVIASPFAIAFFMAPAAHNTVYPCTALLGAYVVWLARDTRRGPLLAWVAPPVVGIAVGACLASDLLVGAAALAPLALTAILAGAQRARRARVLGLSTLVVVGVALVSRSITSSVMRSAGYITLPTPEKAVPLSELPERATLLFKGLKTLFNGYLGGPTSPGTLHAELGFASTVVMSAALIVVLAFGARAAGGLVWSAIRRRESQPSSDLARSVHVVYWVASAGSACGAFWIAGETGGGTDLHTSYYATSLFSVAAVVPLLLAYGSQTRLLLWIGVSIFFLASLVGLSNNYMNITSTIAADTANVTKIAEANHATNGYGGYGASSYTWITHGRVTVRPLMECQNPAGAGICPFYLMSTPSWYVPQQRRSFLLAVPGEAWVSTLPPGLGKPLAAYRLGTLSMYVYPYDIASRLGPQQD